MPKGHAFGTQGLAGCGCAGWLMGSVPAGPAWQAGAGRRRLLFGQQGSIVHAAHPAHPHALISCLCWLSTSRLPAGLIELRAAAAQGRGLAAPIGCMFSSRFLFCAQATPNVIGGEAVRAPSNHIAAE